MAVPLAALVAVIMAMQIDLGSAGDVTVTAPSSTPTARETVAETVADTKRERSIEDLSEYRAPGADRSLKCDLVEWMPSPPQAIIFGGSRAMRFPPDEMTELTGLQSFNAAMHNFRFEDAWTFSNFLFKRSPDTDVACFIALAPTSFSDNDLHPGLLYDKRLSRWLPKKLLRKQREQVRKPKKPVDLLERRHYTDHGLLTWNIYDDRVDEGIPLKERLDQYLSGLLPKAGDTSTVRQARSIEYFEKTIRLYNERGVTPVVVIMPYHPRVLEAFRAVGWQEKVDRLHAILAESRAKRLHFEVVDLLELESFGGDTKEFYDGSHVTTANSRLIIRHVVSEVPHCFDLE